MARTPAAVAEVQKLLLARAAHGCEPEHVGIVGRDRGGARPAAIRHGRAGARDRSGARRPGCPSPDSLNDVETAALVGAVRGLESLARTVRAKKLPPLGERTWDLLRWAATAQRPPADPRSALTRRLAMAALVTGNQATTSVIERGAARHATPRCAALRALAAGDDARDRRARARSSRSRWPTRIRACASKRCARGAATCRRRRARRFAPR